MASKNKEITFLRALLVLSIGILPAMMIRQSKKDWLFAYFFNATTNVILDKLVTKSFITYPTRMLPKIFNIHILYDIVLYPTVTVIYNQMTTKNRLTAILYKVCFFSVPLTLFEFWANRKTGLIKWKNGWKWYHTFLSVSLKSLITRGAVGIFRHFRRRRAEVEIIVLLNFILNFCRT